jgi:hypothetical protein
LALHLREGGDDMLGSAIVIPGIIVLILVILLIVWLVRRA